MKTKVKKIPSQIRVSPGIAIALKKFAVVKGYRFQHAADKVIVEGLKILKS